MSATEYATARQAQDARYEDATGLPIGNTAAQEYRDYFGVGDHAGHPVETRVTFARWLSDHRKESAPSDLLTPDEAFRMSRAQLAVFAAQGDYVAADEIVRRVIKRAGVAA